MSTGWLEGKVGVVAGASRGIGRATAEALAATGVEVVMGSRKTDALEEVASGIRARGGTAVPVRCDVSVPSEVDALFASADELGPLSVLVCAAGVLHKGEIPDITEEVWRSTLDTNLTGAFLCSQRAFPRMLSTGGGRIVTIASLSGVYATQKFPGLAAYNVSKYGVVGLTEALAVERRDHGISAVCISPGAVDTEMLRQAAPHLSPGLGPQDVGRLIVSLLDDDLAPISGANIPLFSNR